MAKHIMVFNDTQEILQLFEAILTYEGYAVSLHVLGDRDVEAVKKQMPDLIISDHSVLKEDLGWQFLQKLKMTPQTAKLPLILCTTNLRLINDNMGQFANMGVLVLAKPFAIDDLLNKVELAIGKADKPNAQRSSLNPDVEVKEPSTK